MEVEGEAAQEEEVEVEAVLEVEEVEEVGVVEQGELVRIMQIIPTLKGSLPVETRNPPLQQS